MFDEIRKESFDEREKRILNFWNEKNIFKRSVEERKEKPLFSFYDGPPFATGLPHYGHFLAGTIKDVVLRFKTMKGFCVPRRFGWDCHGLPVENEIEKAHHLSGAHSIEEFGLAHFNEECRKIVLRYTEEWKELVARMGRWVDFDQTYRTMDLPFMESVWWVFKELYAKGLVYEGFKVMPFSAKLGTPLSNFEAGENYKEVDDPSLTIAISLIDEPNTFLMVWTTTPWTLISNLAVMANPEVDYLKVRNKASGRYYYIAKDRLSTYDKEREEREYDIIKTLKGKDLNDKRYHPLFPHFASYADKGAFRVILDEGVTVEEGTGLVHSAPAFGEADFYACQKANIPLVCPVDSNGCFTLEVPEYTGQFVKNADKDIIKRLKEQGAVIQASTIHHRYPFCWRSDTPLIYKAVRSWFVSVENSRDALVKSNEEIHWTPANIKHGRFGKWLSQARDWAISRNRYWGTPIPLWRSDDGEIIVIGSVEELEKATGAKITDLHRHYIDDLCIVKDGKTFKRISEVFDCWFESGSMPYAQHHYPFENKEQFEKGFPADFIGEGLDQTRGWFYTLTILSTALFGRPAFKNVVVNGIVLAADGTKMSKRLRNYPDPSHVIARYGADAVRLYMMHSPAVKAEDLCFMESGVELVLRQVMIPLWNAFSFLQTYAKIYRWHPAASFTEKPQNALDQWILSLLNKLIKNVEDGMEKYDLSLAVEPFVAFVDQLTNWYIRRSRRRFWDDKPSLDRSLAFATLYHVLTELSKIAASFVPFISEAIYQHLRHPLMPESVHLCDFPSYNDHHRSENLEKAMEAVQSIVSLGHALRKEHKTKVRQPLPSAHIVSQDEGHLRFLQEQQHLIAEELNVKQVIFSSDEAAYVSLKAKPNFRVLGKKVGDKMRAAQKAIEDFDQETLKRLLNGESHLLSVEGQEITLTTEDVAVERKVKDGLVAANLGKVTIALDTALTEELITEGFARELINKINTMRRENGFDVSDRIRIVVHCGERIKESYQKHKELINSEVLCKEASFIPLNGIKDQGTIWDLNGEEAAIVLTKA